MEIDYKKLEEIGIDDNGKKKQFCPECHANRTNKRDKSLSVDWNKCIAHCHYCGKSFFFGKTEKLNFARQPQPKPTETKGYRKPAKLSNEEPLDENMKRWFEGRAIPAEIAEAEGIFKVCRKMPQTGQVEKCIVFPYTVEGKLVNRKYRDGAKHFMLEKDARLVPWRIDSIRDTPECIITEGGDGCLVVPRGRAKGCNQRSQWGTEESDLPR